MLTTTWLQVAADPRVYYYSNYYYNYQLQGVFMNEVVTQSANIRLAPR